MEDKFCHHLPDPTKVCDAKWKQNYKKAHQILSCVTLDSETKLKSVELVLNKISHNYVFKTHIARMLFAAKVMTIPALVDHKLMDSVLEYLECLVTLFPTLATIQDNEGDLPIHNLATNIDGIAKSAKFVSLVESLLVANPNSVSSLNHQGMTVAHILCNKRKTDLFSYAYQLLTKVIEVDPTIARIRCFNTDDGKLPIHFLLDGRTERFESIASALSVLVRAYPACALDSVKREFLAIFLDNSPPRRVSEVWSPLEVLRQHDQEELIRAVEKEWERAALAAIKSDRYGRRGRIACFMN